MTDLSGPTTTPEPNLVHKWWGRGVLPSCLTCPALWILLLHAMVNLPLIYLLRALFLFYLDLLVNNLVMKVLMIVMKFLQYYREELVGRAVCPRGCQT